MLIGLTGGIASGKSTVAKVWESLGGEHVDADVLAREVVARGTPGLEAVVQKFGSGFLDSEGNLDRNKLGQLIFSNQEARTELEAILHPLIQKLAQERIAQLSGRDVFYTIPLLVETNSPLVFDKIVTVSAPKNVRIERLISTRGMSLDEAQNRVRSQVTDTQRESRADIVIDSNCTLDELQKRATAVWLSLKNGSSN